MAADTARMVMQSYQSDNFYQVYGMTEAGPTGTTLSQRPGDQGGLYWE